MIREENQNKSLIKGVFLLCVALVIGIFRTYLLISSANDPIATTVILSIALPFIIFGALLIIMIKKSKKWARTTEVNLLIVGIILNIKNVISWWNYLPSVFILYIAEITVTIVALMYLYNKECSKLFK